ncbi:unnamed protein product [Blepharisma stoltei]|uniref:Uncharacterized protein n=1 Tax=Blepharisma stoltei TaxID=1481888 RepID=A0AAU9KH00_9CILI|nr:unnamed protein product [Blepharisma stoltei]
MEKEWKVFAFRFSKCLDHISPTSLNKNKSKQELANIFPINIYKKEKLKRENSAAHMRLKIKEKKGKIKLNEEKAEKIKQVQSQKLINSLEKAQELRKLLILKYRQMSDNLPEKIEVHSRILSCSHQRSLKSISPMKSVFFKLSGNPKRSKTPVINSNLSFDFYQGSPSFKKKVVFS